jgi:hypothetical protein
VHADWTSWTCSIRCWPSTRLRRTSFCWRPKGGLPTRFTTASDATTSLVWPP